MKGSMLRTASHMQSASIATVLLFILARMGQQRLSADIYRARVHAENSLEAPLIDLLGHLKMLTVKANPPSTG